MARGRVRVEVDLRALKALRSAPEKVLRGLDMPCRDEVRRTLDIASFLVPVGSPDDSSNLAGSTFLEGPIYNLGPPLSTTWLSGYEHPAAGAIHEGFHWGYQAVPPPHWLRRSFKGARGRARKAVAAALMQQLRLFFPGK
jgi:hypothetical protein